MAFHPCAMLGDCLAQAQQGRLSLQWEQLCQHMASTKLVRQMPSDGVQACYRADN